MITVVTGIGPQKVAIIPATVDVTLANGRPPTKTVIFPVKITPGPALQSGPTTISPIQAAGNPPIKT